jgi:hypothetical protein
MKCSKIFVTVTQSGGEILLLIYIINLLLHMYIYGIKF